MALVARRDLRVTVESLDHRDCEGFLDQWEHLVHQAHLELLYHLGVPFLGLQDHPAYLENLVYLVFQGRKETKVPKGIKESAAFLVKKETEVNEEGLELMEQEVKQVEKVPLGE